MLQKEIRDREREKDWWHFSLCVWGDPFRWDDHRRSLGGTAFGTGPWRRGAEQMTSRECPSQWGLHHYGSGLRQKIKRGVRGGETGKKGVWEASGRQIVQGLPYESCWRVWIWLKGINWRDLTQEWQSLVCIYYSHFTDEETEGQRNNGIYWRSGSWTTNPVLFDSRDQALHQRLAIVVNKVLLVHSHVRLSTYRQWPLSTAWAELSHCDRYHNVCKD